MSVDPNSTVTWRPMLLGYVRADVLGGPGEVCRATSELEAFVEREGFTLGRVFLDSGDAVGAFHALLEELTRNEMVRGVLIPDLRHLTCEEQLILSRHESGSRTPVLTVRFAPLAGGPGAASPFRSGPAIPHRRHRATA